MTHFTQVSDPSATIDYTLDNLGRATSIVNTIAGLTPTVTFDQTFDAGSDRTQLKAKIGTTNDFMTDYTFDTLGRMTDIVQQGNSGNAVASKHVTLAYNKLDQYTTFNRYESTGTSNQVASTDFGYDTLNRLTDLDHKQGSTNLSTYDYTYDYASRMTSVNSSLDGLTNYTSDAINQVTGADHTGQTDETFSFDANGNRSSYTIGTNNLATSDGTYNYAYDDEGNRTTKTNISNGSYTTYAWDYRNRLTAVRDYNVSNVLLKETTYAYDASNRLIKSTYDADGAGSGAATSRYWAFDQSINPQIEFKSSSASDVSQRYLWGPTVDQLFADEQPTSTGSAGNVLWGLGDNLGTIRDIADLSGSTTSVTNHRRFGAFGDLVSESNSAVDMAFAFTGKFYDENTKLQNNLNRWYDASIGQWMSEDPLQFKAGDENIRRYATNSALVLKDVDGLQEIPWRNGPPIWPPRVPPQQPQSMPMLKAISQVTVKTIETATDDGTVFAFNASAVPQLPQGSGPCYHYAHSMTMAIGNAMSNGQLPTNTTITPMHFAVNQNALPNVRARSHIIIRVNLPNDGPVFLDAGLPASRYGNIGGPDGVVDPAKLKKLVDSGALIPIR